MLLVNADLSKIHKVQQRLHVHRFDTLQVEKWVLVRVAVENVPEEGRAGRDDELVRAQLLALAHQRHVQEVLGRAQVAEGRADVGLEVIPA